MHEYMVAISRQCPFGADKSVQISWAVFLDKGTQTELLRKKKKRNRPINQDI